MRAGRAGHVGPMWLPPGARNDLVLGRRNIHGVVQPAMPRRRNCRGLRHAVVDDPAALEPKVRVDLATPRAVVAIAELVLTDELAIEAGPDLRAAGPAVPPCEEAQQEIHRARHRTLRTQSLGPGRAQPRPVDSPRNVAARPIAPHTGTPMLERRAVAKRDIAETRNDQPHASKCNMGGS